MKRILVAVLFLVACSKESTGTGTTKEPNTQCELGKSCKDEGATCSPAPIGSGWAHAMTCTRGKWTELEIAPLPTPLPKPSASSP